MFDQYQIILDASDSAADSDWSVDLDWSEDREFPLHHVDDHTNIYNMDTIKTEPIQNINRWQ